MKLVRYGNPGKEKPGLIDAHGQLRDLSKVIKDITPDQLGDAALKKLAKLNTDDNPNTAAKYNISAIPTMLLFKGGQMVEQFVGMMDKASLKAKLAGKI